MLRGLPLLFFLSAIQLFGAVQPLPALPNATVANSVQVDAAGNIYVAGWFYPHPPAFPAHAFVGKLSPDGSQVIWWTVLSGVLLVATAVTQPDGVSVAMGQQLAWVRKRLPFSFGSGSGSSGSGSASSSQLHSRQHQLAGVPVSSGEPPGPDLAERTPTAARHGDD